MNHPIKPPQLTDLETALADIFAQLAAHENDANFPKFAIEKIDINAANARISAEVVRSPINQPPFANSMMDGYALRVEDWHGANSAIRIHQRIAAGQAPTPLPKGFAARIFTGALIPKGANAVLMQEACREENGQVYLNEAPSSKWINAMGQDVMLGAEVLLAGSRITPAVVGLLAGVGLAKINVVKKIKVAIVATGDELITPGSCAPNELPTGKIFNSNLSMLQTLITYWGADTPTVVSLPDNRKQTEQTLAKLATNHQLIITSGGASVGEEDHVRAIMQARGMLSLWQLAIKPGKPFMFGKWQHEAGLCWLTGLPGNPVAAWVTALLLVRPLMLGLQGNIALSPFDINAAMPHTVPAIADFNWSTPDKKRREFLRVFATTDWHSGKLRLQLKPNQKSAVLTSVVGADGLLDNAIGQNILPGDLCRFIPFSTMLS